MWEALLHRHLVSPGSTAVGRDGGDRAASRACVCPKHVRACAAQRRSHPRDAATRCQVGSLAHGSTHSGVRLRGTSPVHSFKGFFLMAVCQGLLWMVLVMGRKQSGQSPLSQEGMRNPHQSLCRGSVIGEWLCHSTLSRPGTSSEGCFSVF